MKRLKSNQVQPAQSTHMCLCHTQIKDLGTRWWNDASYTDLHIREWNLPARLKYKVSLAITFVTAIASSLFLKSDAAPYHIFFSENISRRLQMGCILNRKMTDSLMRTNRTSAVVQIFLIQCQHLILNVTMTLRKTYQFHRTYAMF